jgi:hypothetical protein
MRRARPADPFARSSLVQEMACGELGDQRLNERRDRLVAILEQHPDAGFPDACADDADVEALYRFLRNQRVSLDAVIEPHLMATQQRCTAAGTVLVIHDTTDMVFAGERPRAGLVPLSTRRQGFWLHTALAVSADGLRAPLGVLSLMPFLRKTRPPGSTRRWRQRRADPTKESRCWPTGIAAARARLGTGGVEVIHVMDRGADSYELFATLVTQGERFVARLAQERSVLTDEGLTTFSAAAPPAAACVREVSVAPRRAGNRPMRARTRYPPRDGRLATLHVAARRLVVQRPHRLPTLPPSLAVHVVDVWEATPPPGEEPVMWRLMTTEPIDTVAQILQIVDWYRARWVIEEYFKALKTGCAYEKRQLESLDTLLVALALLAPIAWQLLLLRHLARHAPTAAATAVLSRQQLRVLRAAPQAIRLSAAPTIEEALRAVARLGGHLRQNGPPGWLVLGRGMQKLRWMEAGWAAAQDRAM